MNKITLKSTYICVVKSNCLNNVNYDKIDYLIKYLINDLQLPILIPNFNNNHVYKVIEFLFDNNIFYRDYIKLKKDLYNTLSIIYNEHILLESISFNNTTKTLKIILKG